MTGVAQRIGFARDIIEEGCLHGVADVVVGIGDDGFAGLGRPARRALLEASAIYGGERHLSMLPARLAARRAAWPRPFDLAPLLAERGRSVCVLASGDPMLFGVGATLASAVTGRRVARAARTFVVVAGRRPAWLAVAGGGRRVAGRPAAADAECASA